MSISLLNDGIEFVNQCICALKAFHCSLKILCRLIANEMFILKFKWATSSANLQLRALLTFRFSVISGSNLFSGWVVPDFAPLVYEDIAETFKVALAWVNVSVRSNAHVD